MSGNFGGFAVGQERGRQRVDVADDAEALAEVLGVFHLRLFSCVDTSVSGPQVLKAKHNGNVPAQEV